MNSPASVGHVARRRLPDVGRRRRRAAFTIREAVAVIVVIGVMLAVLIPYIAISRETARRTACAGQLGQHCLAVQNYTTTFGVLPPGTICATRPSQPSNQYDVWGEASKTEGGFHGTSMWLRLLPFFELCSRFNYWNFAYGVARNGRENADGRPGQAVEEFPFLYCPSRRSRLRRSDRVMMLDPSWEGGGTDYGSCAGRHAAFTNKTGYNLCDATTHYEPDFRPIGLDAKPVDDDADGRWGIFGRVNVSTKPKEIFDGMSNTILLGELQRITTITPGSKDGWAVGGPATLFTTGALIHFDGQGTRSVTSPADGTPLNNMFWGSPGSGHPGGANFGLADASTRFIATLIDPSVFALLGSMADGAEKPNAEPPPK